MSTTSGTKVSRQTDLDSREFWEGIDRGELLLQRCADCGTYRWPFRCICNRCRSWNTEVVPSTRHGSIFSWAVNRHPFAPGFGDRLPFINVLVRLDEQDDLVLPGILDEIDPPDDLAIGDRVVAHFGGTDDIVWRLAGPT